MLIVEQKGGSTCGRISNTFDVLMFEGYLELFSALVLDWSVVENG